MRRILGLQLLDWLWLFIIVLMGAVTIFGLVGCETPGREKVDAVEVVEVPIEEGLALGSGPLKGYVLPDHITREEAEAIVAHAERVELLTMLVKDLQEGITKSYRFWANPTTDHDITLGIEEYETTILVYYTWIAREFGQHQAKAAISEARRTAMKTYAGNLRATDRIQAIEGDIRQRNDYAF